MEIEELIQRLKDCSLGEYNTYEVKFEDLQHVIKHLERYVKIKKIVDNYKISRYFPWDCTGYFGKILDVFEDD